MAAQSATAAAMATATWGIGTGAETLSRTRGQYHRLTAPPSIGAMSPATATRTSPSNPPAAAAPAVDAAPAISALVAMHGEPHRARIERGVRQCARRWAAADGDQPAFDAFCRAHFVADPAKLPALLDRLEAAMEKIGGHLYEMRRSLRRWSDLAGEEFPGVDDLLATFDPAPDLSEQLYRQRLAFIALLNLDRADLATMMAHGDRWTTDDWAAVRIAQQFGARIPSSLNDRAREVSHRCSRWVSGFHVPVGRLVDPSGSRWYGAERALLTHWLVREEIKAQGTLPDGLPRQRALAHVLGRAIDGSVPTDVMDRRSGSDWDAARNTLGGTPVRGDGSCHGEDVMGPVRYERWLEQFRLAREFDAHHPEHPTAIARKFELAREMPETQIERLLTDLLDHPARATLTGWLAQRLGRPLEAFDIYFEDVGDATDADALNAAVRSRFPDEGAFERALPEVLRDLGFPAKDAQELGTRIRVEIARGSGHAMRPALPQFDAWLRTSRLANELGWDGFDTAMHELGHNLEQLCSTLKVARPALRNVPNTACTEAFAFLYQSLGRRVLGIDPPGGAERAHAADAVATMLSACQIAGPSLLELHTWRWLYANPDADAPALRAEVLATADRLWARHYAQHYGPDPYRLLAAYQHMIAHPLYLADYAIGHVMSHQIRDHIRGKDIAAETIRITSIGRLTPDLWMRRATGSPLSIDTLARDAAAGIALLH
jgi:hypothetical protein